MSDSAAAGASAGTQRILLITNVFPPRIGGSGRWLWELYRRMRGFDVSVAATGEPGAAAFDASSGMTIHRLPLDFPSWGVAHPHGALRYARAFRRLDGLAARERADAVHCGKCLPEGLLALLIKRRRGIPYVCYAHGEELTLALLSRELRWLTHRVLAGAALVVANTAHTRDILSTRFGVGPGRVVVLHPGVDTARFAPAPPDAAVRHRLGWQGRRVVLTVGALQKRKGQDMLIRALPAIRARCPDVLYVMIGDGRDRAYLERLIAEHGVGDLVRLRGVPPDEELIESYQQCDVFALPNREVESDIEGFGIVLIEAQACGKPVVAGTSGGTPEAVDAGRSGELVPSETPDRLATVVAALLDDPDRRSAMGRHGREWVVSRFDWGVLSQQAERALARTGR
jgi:phosphatidylinositol alpha-1,6-mannosyltransferase